MWPKKDSSSTAKKCAIKQESETFFGRVFSAEGYSPDPEKIQGISKMTPPQMKQELQSFLGAVNYLQMFIPHLSLNTEPLQALLKKENSFTWDKNTNTCFQKIKSQLQKALLRPLRYYDQSKLVTLQCDASLKGLGACIIQDRQPIAFASKSLMDTETHYANIERELLAIVYGCEKIPHIPVWKDIHRGDGPQAPWDDQPKKSHSSPCTPPEDAPPSAAVWPGHHILARQRNASGGCPQLPPIQNKHWDQVGSPSQCHIDVCHHPKMSDQDWSRDTMGPHPLDGADLPSPAEILHGHPTQGAVLSRPSKRVNTCQIRQRLIELQEKQKEHFDKAHRAKDLCVLKVKEQVQFFHNKQGTGPIKWTTCIVTEILECGWSYMIQGHNGLQKEQSSFEAHMSQQLLFSRPSSEKRKETAQRHFLSRPSAQQGQICVFPEGNQLYGHQVHVVWWTWHTSNTPNITPIITPEVLLT